MSDTILCVYLRVLHIMQRSIVCFMKHVFGSFVSFFSTFASAAYNFYNMPLSDIADKDTERYNRK